MGCRHSSAATVEHVPVSTKTAEVDPVVEQANTTEPEVETAPPSVEEEEEVVEEEEKKFTINGVSITEQGVVYYHIQGSNVSIKRRYNDFKALYVSVNRPSLPSLPDASLRAILKGRHHQDLMKEREVQFAHLLNAMAQDPEVSESEVFQTFLTAV